MRGRRWANTGEISVLPAKEYRVAFVESSAEARRISELELIQHQGLNCPVCNLQSYSPMPDSAGALQILSLG